MSTLVSSRISALRQKLRQAEHAGQYFSSDDVAGLVRELKSIGQDAAALEDRVAAARREPSRPATVMRPGAIAVGTFFFQPAGEARQ